MKKCPLLILFVFFFLFLLIIRFDLFFNIRTASMPLGIYRRVNDVPRIGSIVSSCLTKELAQYGLKRGYLMKGNCATGVQPVLKKVYAVSGDFVSIVDDYVSINGEILYEFPVNLEDSNGRGVKHFLLGGHYLVDGEYFLLSDYNLNSWDSRYWDSVPVNFVVEPLVIYNE